MRDAARVARVAYVIDGRARTLLLRAVVLRGRTRADECAAVSST